MDRKPNMRKRSSEIRKFSLNSRSKMMQKQNTPIRQRGSIGRTKIKHPQKTVKQNDKLKKVFGGGLISLFTRTRQPAQNDNQQVKQQQQSKTTHLQKIKISNLIKASNKINHEERLNKAYRHFDDALNLRQIRNDLDRNIFQLSKVNPNLLIRFIYKLQISPFFQNTLFRFSIIYVLLAFNEPANQYVIQPIDYFNYYLEIILLGSFSFDIILELSHLRYDIERETGQKYYKNGPLICKILFQSVLLIDFFQFYFDQEVSTMRFGRYVRPFLMFLYEKDLRRSIKSIINSFQEIIQLFLFVIIMTLFWSLVGIKMIGNLDDQVPYDQYDQNFDNMWTSYIILYALISPEGYPDCMMPAYQVSAYYLIYFLPYIILYQLLFVPIPVAIVFNAYRDNRGKLVIMDRLKQREALLACFIALDLKEIKSVQYDVFEEFMIKVYLGCKRQRKHIPRLFSLMDVNKNLQIPVNGFFEIIDIIESNSLFTIPTLPESPIWQKFRSFMNRKLHLKYIALSLWFELIMFFIVIFNCGIVITLMIIDGPADLVSNLSQIDDYSLYIYIVECCIKLIGLGINKYFEDDWNKFDFVMVMISLLSSFFQNVLSFLKSAKTLKSSKILRLTKLNRIFRAFRALRTLKVVNFLVIGADTLIQLKIMVQRIILCIPLVLKLIPIILTLVYLWAILGMELWNTDTYAHKNNSPYDQSSDYADFTSFGGAILVLLQVTLSAKWDQVLYDYSYKFDEFLWVLLYFVTFHMIMELILLSLIKGIIWEIFMIVEQTTKEHAQMQELWEEKSQIEKNLIINFQSIDDINHAEQQLSIKPKTTLSTGYQEYEAILLNLSFGDKLSNVHIELREDSTPQDSPKKHKKASDLKIRKQTSIDCDIEDFKRDSSIVVLEKRLKPMRINTYLRDEEKDVKKECFIINENCGSSIKQSVPNSTPKLSGKSNSSTNTLQNQRQRFFSHTYIPGYVQPKQSNESNLENITSSKRLNQIDSHSGSGSGSSSSSGSGSGSGSQSNSDNEDSQQIVQSQKEMFALFIMNKLKTRKQLNINEQSENNRSNNIQLILKGNELSVGSFMKQVMVAQIADDKDESKRSPEQQKRSLKTQLQQSETFQPQFNQNYVLKKAMLRETSLRKIQQLEKNYFQSLYGTIYDTPKEAELGSLLNFQAIQLQSLEMMLRYNSQNYLPTISMITHLENSVSHTLLPRGSMLKFIFMDSLQNWFFLNNENKDLITPLQAGQGPWNLTNKVLIHEYKMIAEDKIMIGLDFFQPSLDYEIGSPLFEYFTTFRHLIDSLKGPEQQKDNLKYQTSILDLFILQLSSQNKIQLDKKSHKYVKEMNVPQFEQLALKVTKVMVIVLSYQGEIVTRQKRRFAIRSGDTPQDECPPSPQHMIKKLKMEKLKITSNNDQDAIHDSNNYLPLPFVVEFIESLRTILQVRIDNLLIKMTQYVNGRVSDLQQKQSPPPS